MNDALVRIALGVSLTAVSVLLIQNAAQKQALNEAYAHISKMTTWGNLVKRVMSDDMKKSAGEERTDVNLYADVQAYLILRENGMA